MLPNYVANYMINKALKRFNMEGLPLVEKSEKPKCLVIKLNPEYKISIEIPYTMLSYYLWQDIEENKKENISYSDFEKSFCMMLSEGISDYGYVEELMDAILDDVEARQLPFDKDEDAASPEENEDEE